MKSYSTTPARRKFRGPNQISDRYWLALNRLYGRNRSGITTAAGNHQINELNAEKLQKALP